MSNGISVDDLFAFINRFGRDPYRRASKSRVLSVDAGVGEANYLLQIPLLNLPGRGLDLSLTLYYNSKLWLQQNDPYLGTTLVFDLYSGWPAAGWSLGFGKMLQIGENSVLQDADGTLHPFSSGHNGFYTTDGTLIDYNASWNGAGPAGANGIAKYPDGTSVLYGAGSSGPNYYAILRVFPTRITDANGNSIEITYVNDAGQAIESITDTLGRTVDFVYGDVDLGSGTIRKLLTAIQAPGLKGTTREVARFHYFVPNMRQPPPENRLDPIPIPGTGFYAIYMPGTSTGYWFGDPDSYTNSSGIITKVSQRRAMTLTSTSASDEGTITPGEVTRERRYNYPADLEGTNIPTYTTMTERWVGMDTLEATTTYTVDTSSSPRRIDIVYPDGTQVTQLMYNHPGQYDDGLLYQVTTYDSPDPTTQKLMQQVQNSWQEGDYKSARIWNTSITDELGQVRSYSYGYFLPTKTNQLTAKAEFIAAGVGIGESFLRQANYSYEPDPEYVNRHIFNLPASVEVVELGDQTMVVRSLTEYGYDGQVLLNYPGLPGYQDPATNYRGNLSSITRYLDVYTPAEPIVESRSYDIAGNMVARSGATYEQTTYSYEVATGYAYPATITSGSATPGSPDVLVQSFTYDPGTSLLLTATDVNGRTTQSAYDNSSLRIQQLTLPTGAIIGYSYDDAKMTTTKTTYTAPGEIAAQATTHFNGLGLVGSVITATSASTWTGVATGYDALGRPNQYSQPYPCGPSGLPTVPQLFTTVARDALGRVTSQQAPDGSTTSCYYNEPNRPSSASPTLPGQTIRVQSPDVTSLLGEQVPGADMWYRIDGLGSLAEVVEPNAYGPWPGGSVFGPGNVKTSYSYNALGLLVQVSQGAEGKGAKSQFDSLGRLTAQYLPEKGMTLDSTGAYAGADGEWSDVFTYDQRSNLTSRTDARGVKTVLDYSPTPGGPADPLNRVYKVSYQNVGQADTTMEPTYDTFYAYMPTGDVTRLLTVTTSPAWLSEAVREYAYNADGLVTSDQLTWRRPGASPQALRVDYAYDTLGRIVSETYPVEYGSATARRRKKAAYTYNRIGQLAGVQVDGRNYASGVVYNPAGQATTITIGSATSQPLTETYVYDPKTNLLTSQRVQMGESDLLNLSYSYYPNQQLQLLSDNKGSSQIGYMYDALGRLWRAAASVTGGAEEWSEEYTFDEYGNRTAVTSTGQLNGVAAPPDGLPSLAYDTATNHISTDGFTYDLAGNLTRGQRTDGSWLRYRYDQAGHLVSVTTDSGLPIESYGYDSDGRRLITRQAGDSTYFVWSRGRPIAEYAQQSAGRRPTLKWLTAGARRRASQAKLVWSTSRIYLGNRTLATFKQAKPQETVFYHHPDRLGTRLVTDNGNNTTWEQTTLPFGTLMPGTPQWINPLFTTYDAGSIPGLYYAVNRTYDSELRFTQPDPIGLAAVDISHPQTLNMYAYVGNDPVNSVDPSGLGDTWTDVVMGGLSLLGGVYGLGAGLFEGSTSAFVLGAIGLGYGVLETGTLLAVAPFAAIATYAFIATYTIGSLPGTPQAIETVLSNSGPGTYGSYTGWQTPAAGQDQAPESMDVYTQLPNGDVVGYNFTTGDVSPQPGSSSVVAVADGLVVSVNPDGSTYAWDPAAGTQTTIPAPIDAGGAGGVIHTPSGGSTEKDE